MLGLLIALICVGLSAAQPGVYSYELTAMWWANTLMYWYACWAAVEMVLGLFTFVTIVGPLAFGILAARNVLGAVSCYLVSMSYVGGVWNVPALVVAAVLLALFAITMPRGTGDSK